VKDLPVQLQEWANAHEPSKGLIFAPGYWKQIIFIRDNISEVLATSFGEYREIGEKIQVISTHTSKSVLLPVFRIELNDGTFFILRYNFYSWKVSVNSPRDIEVDFLGLFDPEDESSIMDFYCEGFPKDLVYGPYAKNKRQFTVEIYNDFRLFAFFWLFAYQVLGKRKKTKGRGDPMSHVTL